MLPRIAAITMVYNEAVLLPLWARHYARQVGADQCYVVDHGSTERLELPPGTNTVRLPRSPHDDERRAAFISDLAGSLLRYYDWVLYTDVDELVVADPRRHRDLPAFCAALGAVETVTAIGLDVQHVPALEPPLDPALPLGQQRGWVRFTSAMCKPVLTRRKLHWAPGFHWSEQPIRFSELYLFHLHWADQQMGLGRIAKTRAMPWAGDRHGGHQRMGDEAWLRLFGGMADLPRRTDASLNGALPPVRDWLRRTEESRRSHSGGAGGMDLGINADELWPIPPHFRDRL